MKILDKYLLKSFLITFATVFVILFFIFVLQVVWLFISELAGKDLDFIMILKFLLFKMPSIIPLVLPLSILLASIMTFGSLAENYEFAAMKSSGISLQRSMKTLIYFITILSVLAFFFANNVIPYAEYKFINFRRNIAQVKPALAIAEGQFSQVGTYNIKVEKKSGNNGRFLSGITIHKLSSIGAGSNTVIKAKNGELISSENSNILKLVLKDGYYYEDIIPKKFEDRNKVPFAKSEFKTYIINIDLSKLNSSNMDEEQITNTNTMLNVSELKFTLDSLQKNYNKDLVSISENINSRSALSNSNFPINSNSGVPSKVVLNQTNILHYFSDSDKLQMLRVASSNVDATNFSLESSRFELEDKQKNMSLHWIALYDKFVIAFACLLMFFIGAPLGSIIRKGGLGLPIVFAILIFIIFHFINTFGKKVAQEGGISPFMGCWMSTFVLGPLAILLTKRATEDRGVSIDFGWFITIYNRLFPAENEAELADSTIGTEGNFAVKEENKTQQKVAPKKEAILIDIVQIESYLKQYQTFSLFAFAGYVILLIIAFTSALKGAALLISIAIIGCLFYFTIYKSQIIVLSIGKQTENKPDLNIIIVLLGAFPFYPLFYFYNRSYLKEVTSEYTKSTH